MLKKENKKRLHTVCGIVTAVLLLIAGICFIVSCLSIYQSGEKPFSPESVAAHFAAIRVPVMACVVSVAVSAILSIVFPAEAGKIKTIREEADILVTLKRKAGSLTDKELAANATREQNRQKSIRFFTGCILIGAFVPHIIYFADASHFTVEGLNQNILACMLGLSFSVLVSLATLIVNARLTKRSLLREIAVYKTAIAEKKCGGIAPAAKAQKDTAKTTLTVRCALCAIAVVFIMLGIFNGGIQDVLGKAIAICTECIGLG